MIRWISLVAAAVLLSMAAVSTVGAQQFPPNRFFGTVTVNGQPAPTGTTVTALIDSTTCATATTTAGGSYVIDVPGVTINPNCGRSGQSTVTFQVNGQTAGTATYRDGGFVQLNLSVGGGGPQPTATPAPTAAPTTAPTATPRPPTATPAPTTAPTAAPTTAPTATPRPATPTAQAQRPAAPVQKPAAPAAQKPAAPAAPAAQRPAAAAPAPAALPRTGTGGLQSADTGLTTGWTLVGLAVAVFGLGAAAVVTVRRRA